MTQQDDITQRVLTDDEIRAVWVEHGLDDEAVEDFARAIESAVLSKLRAPVSSIREGFELTYAADADDPACASDLSHFTNGWRACVMSQVRAPVADERAAFDAVSGLEPPCASRRGNHFREGYLEARADALRVLGTLASAPVAGEAQRLPTINVGGKERPQQWFTAKEVRQLLDAAPQASEALDTLTIDLDYADGASVQIEVHGTERMLRRLEAWLGGERSRIREQSRNAALDDAAKVADYIGNTHYVEYQYDKAAGADQVADAILALKSQPQADKDGGQQRAGDDDLLRFAWKAIRAELDPQWECNSYHPMLYAAEERLRAALSAPQAEQGERDA